MLKNSFVPDAVTCPSKTVPNMESILLNSSVSSAALQLSGSVGAIPTFVSRATRDNAMATTYQSTQKINYRSAKDLANVQLGATMEATENRKC